MLVLVLVLVVVCVDDDDLNLGGGSSDFRWRLHSCKVENEVLRKGEASHLSASTRGFVRQAA